MKRLGIKFLLVTCVVLSFISCSDKRSPGKIYMPDMAYSKAYEAYSPTTLDPTSINYRPYPVAGTMRRGDLAPYTLSNDSVGYNQSASIKNPLPAPDSIQLGEAKRLFNINCAICHGANMDAQGPLAGKVGGIANLMLPQFVKMSEGTMYHVVTHGKNMMGSYAAQLDRKQRWMVIQYVKSFQNKSNSDSTTSSSGQTASSRQTDTTIVAK